MKRRIQPSAEGDFSISTAPLRQPSAHSRFDLERERANEYLARLDSVAKHHPVPTVLIGIGLAWFLLSYLNRPRPL